MAGYYYHSDWDAPEIAEWRDDWNGEPRYEPEAYRCFPFPVLGGLGIGIGFAGFFCNPRRFCYPRSFGCRPRFFYGCYPRHFGCYPV